MDIERYDREQAEKLAEMYRYEREAFVGMEFQRQSIPNRAARRKAKSLKFK